MADDILNISCTISGIESDFRILNAGYGEVGLPFNKSKAEIMIFNPSSKEPIETDIGGELLKPRDSLIYLGLPIEPSVRATRQLLKSFYAEKTRKFYGFLIPLIYKFCRAILGKVYNTFVIFHFLALTLF